MGRGIYNDGGNRNLPMKQKRCPRCGGLLVLDEDDCGKYLTCMGCARFFDLEGKPLEVPQFIKDELKSKRYGVSIGEEGICGVPISQ